MLCWVPATRCPVPRQLGFNLGNALLKLSRYPSTPRYSAYDERGRSSPIPRATFIASAFPRASTLHKNEDLALFPFPRTAYTAK